MIIQETIVIPLFPNNINHYENLGYYIPRYIYTKHYQKVLKVKEGTKIEVKVSDLPKSSNVKVLCKCDVCGKENLIEYYRISKDYLCKKCSFNTNDFKEKQRNFHLGKRHKLESIQKMKKNNWMKGRIGEKHPNWRFDLTELEKLNIRKIPGIGRWKKLVKERDNYTCQNCCSKEHLCVHHINNFSHFKEQRTLVENGITLCKECHKLLHRIFGLKTTLSDFNDFMNIFDNHMTYNQNNQLHI